MSMSCMLDVSAWAWWHCVVFGATTVLAMKLVDPILFAIWRAAVRLNTNNQK